MKTRCRFLLLPLAGLLLGLLPLRAAGPGSLHEAAAQVADPAKSAAAIQKLRAAGPAGMQALVETYFKSGAQPQPAAEIRQAFDAVGQQRDNTLSQLYWFTDLPAAEAAAKQAGKPILSLRLLGKLNEEYSCANSRFFRTTLYANAQVAAYLRAHFILHWQSVRPVPRITIDMGDGRKIERTITGNSIHYILDAEGRPIDALPGLYSPQAFLAGLQSAETAELAARWTGPEREASLRAYHGQETARLRGEWARDLARVGQPAARTLQVVALGRNPSALSAAALATSKSGVEGPLLRASAQTITIASSRDVETTSGEDWSKLANLHLAEVQLDAPTRELIAAKQPDLAPAMALTASKMLVETPMSRMLRQLTASIAEDTVRNEYQLHTRLHEWLAQAPTPALDALNRRVYAELFLTPDSDPWLGLAPADTFSALDRGGLVEPAR